MVGQHRPHSFITHSSSATKESTSVFNTSDEVLGFISDEEVKFVDVRFCDLPGIMQHFTVPVQSFGQDTIDEGLAFDGSSVRGFQEIHESDMLLLPDLATAPVDPFADLRDAIVLNLIDSGFTVERAHHEVGTAGQAEINYKFNTLLHAADDLQLFKYIVKNTAWAHGRTATFMPKPLFGDNGSGMHCHQSLWKDGEPLFHDESGYAGLSDNARHYIGGLLHHAPSLLAFTNPTVNSYHRLVPGFEAPVSLVYSQRNRSACVRIPITGDNKKAKRIEFRCPDSSGNPYLAFSAMVMAGLDGIKNKIEPAAPVDKDLYELPPEELKDVAQVPASLDAVIDRLEADHEFLLQGGVFTPDVIDTWVDFKREHEIDPLRLRPHPYEFALYYDVLRAMP